MIGLAAVLVPVVRAARVEPVEFVFAVGARFGGDPFAREIWAEVETPSGRIVPLPAYYAGAGRFVVRARANERGEFRLGAVSEMRGGRRVAVKAEPVGAAAQQVEEPSTMPTVRTVKGPPGRFVRSDGEPYVPLGVNLAWAEGEPVAWYAKAFGQLGAAGGNWTRIWMASWGGLNLDWPAKHDTWPEPGQLDAEVAARWDAILAEAERHGIHVQLVLQHHGQYSSEVNPNWNSNPWNAANPGGFLRRPADFFASPQAIRLTKQKYRYIVARWGYSPAVLAWELFNEVHWTDAVRIERNEAIVARWHRQMAGWIRHLDVYQHLVTTSSEDLRSPVYDGMDYLQPHLYATAMLAAARRFDVSPEQLDRPVFYGEVGNDHMRQTPEQAQAGTELAPLVWASVMGEGTLPAQLWEGAKLLDQGRLPEWRAIARFLAATRLGGREGLAAFSAVVEGGEQRPLRVEVGEIWRRRPVQDIEVPNDGRQPLPFGVIPQILVGGAASIRDGYASKLSLRVDQPKSTTATLWFNDCGAKGAAVRVQIDGKTVATQVWPPLEPTKRGQPAAARPATVTFPLPAGPHVIALENTGGADWIDWEALDLGYAVSALRAIGRRGPDFAALWLWHQTGVWELVSPPATAATVIVPDLPAGTWHVTWWNTSEGLADAPVTLDHPGGALSLPTPPISRHAAVTLTRD